MKLVDLDTAREWLNLKDGTKFDKSLNVALDHAGSRLAFALRTDFFFAENVDRFYLDPSDFTVKNMPLVGLKLRNGFVRATPTPVLSVAPSMAGFFDSTASALTLETDYLIDREYGRIKLLTRHPGMFIQVTYNSGFNFSAGDFGKDITETDSALVPDWLKVAAIDFAGELLRAGLTDADSSKADAKLGDIPTAVFQMIEPHIRIMNTAVKAL